MARKQHKYMIFGGTEYLCSTYNVSARAAKAAFLERPVWAGVNWLKTRTPDQATPPQLGRITVVRINS